MMKNLFDPAKLMQSLIELKPDLRMEYLIGEIRYWGKEVYRHNYENFLYASRVYGLNLETAEVAAKKLAV